MESFEIYIILAVSLALRVTCTDLEDETTSLFHGNIPNKVVIAAYGDYNADKLVDIFVTGSDPVGLGGQNIEVLLARENKDYRKQHLVNVTATSKNAIITSVMPADFNGDALMDILLTTKDKSNLASHIVDIYVALGTDIDKDQKLGPLTHITTARDQPTLFDYNQDMLPDFLIEANNESHTLIVFQASTSGNFTELNFPGNNEKLHYPHSNAFVDLTQNYMADLFITTENGYQIWKNIDGEMELNKTIPLPPKKGWHLGQVSFADLDRDGYTNLLVPLCYSPNNDGSCSQSEIWGYSVDGETTEWMPMLGVVKQGSDEYNFFYQDVPTLLLPALPITLRLGDYNMDGYPDALVFMQKGKDVGEKYAMLLENVPCVGTINCFLNRTFAVDANSELSSIRGAFVGSFFDIYEDGVLDIMLVTITTTQDKNKDSFPVLRVLRQTSTTDTCFIKVTVTSGKCSDKNCPYGRQPYGVNVPGPVVKFNTVSVNGDHQKSSNTQLSQSAHLALQLPFVFFGLGLTPNFVDIVGVGIPVFDSKTGAGLEHDWTQIIPNSQLVVIPYPIDKPEKWILKLFATPSQSVMITGAVLLGTMGFVAGIIGILQWRERREDQKEKRQESHKFHFDAM